METKILSSYYFFQVSFHTITFWLVKCIWAEFISLLGPKHHEDRSWTCLVYYHRVEIRLFCLASQDIRMQSGMLRHGGELCIWGWKHPGWVALGKGSKLWWVYVRENQGYRWRNGFITLDHSRSMLYSMRQPELHAVFSLYIYNTGLVSIYTCDPKPETDLPCILQAPAPPCPVTLHSTEWTPPLFSDS